MLMLLFKPFNNYNSYISKAKEGKAWQACTKATWTPSEGGYHKASGGAMAWCAT